MKVFAHRGYRQLYPENTKSAFQAAVDAGADGIELDVHLTADGEVVICHDESLWRTARQEGLIMSYTLEQLRRFNFSIGHPKDSSEKVMTLPEYFQWVKDYAVVTNIELKTNILPYRGLVEKVAQYIHEYDMTDRVLLSSFNHKSLRAIKTLCPTVPAAILVVEQLMEPYRYILNAGFDGYHPPHFAVSAEDIRQCHEHGIFTNIWFSDQLPDRLESVIEWGADGLIHDDPVRVRQYLENQK